MARNVRNRSIPRSRLALAVAAALMPFTHGAQAQTASNTLPAGGTVAAGTATISTPGAATMQINQASDKAILNWQSFSIGSGAWVNFTQPSASAIALNRVVGTNPSEIFGRLTANGQVFLSNPGGVLFAPGASVDVGALFATTLSISDSDFLAGNYHFYNAGAAGSVLNQGSITAGSYAALAAPQVRNEGLIVANSGAVTLAAGDRVSLDMVGDGLIRVSVDQAAVHASAINSGTLQADGGRVVLTARSASDLLDTVVNNAGVIRANSLVARNGEIILDGGTAGVVRQAGALQGGGVAVTASGDKVSVDTGSVVDALASSVTLNALSDISVDAPLTLASGVFTAGAGGDVAVNTLVSSQNMSISAGGALLLNGSGARDAVLASVGGQNIAAGALGAHAQDGRRAVIQNTGGNQTVNVGAGGIDLSVVDGRGVAQIANNPGATANGTQTVSTTGVLNVVGGSAGASRNSGVFQNQTGKQTVTAGSIALQAAVAAVSNGGALISNTSGGASSNQEINVAAGSIRLTGGGIGFNNRAVISTNGNQTINGNADIFVTGGSSGTGTNVAGTNNSASISANGAGKTQTIHAHDITLQAGPGGTDTFAVITSNNQAITATGDVHITGGANFGDSNGARIGASGNTTTGTQLTLTAHDVTLTGGTTDSGAAIGNSANSPGLPNTISISASGNVVLNGGDGNGARIGSPNGDTGGGSVDIDAAGSIVLNGGVHAANIRTGGDLTLKGASISENANGQILANSLVLDTSGAADLGGTNTISLFNGTSGGNMLLNNSGPLSITGITAGGTLALTNAGALTLLAAGTQDALVNSAGGQTVTADSISLIAQDGRRARLTNNGFGDQTITATAGDIDLIAVDGAGTAKIVNGLPGFFGIGNQTVTASGALNVAGGNSGGTSVGLIQSGVFQNTFGTQTVNAGSITLRGSDFVDNGAALITNQGGGGDQHISAGGSIGVLAGSASFGNRAGILTNGQQTIDAGGDVVVTGGAGGFGSAASGANNSASITAGFGAMQTIHAANLTVSAGSGGIDTFAAIFAGRQNIGVSGDVTLNGGGGVGSASGARIGGASGSATNLALAAHNVVINGGSTSGAGLGSSPNGTARPNNISIDATGDVELNALSGAGVRIGGTPVNGVVGGDIAIHADGNIALNGLAGAAAIRTTDSVTLQANGSISETGDASILANTLATSSGTSTILAGGNQVSAFNGTSGGDMVFNNSGDLSVSGITAGGTLTLTNRGALGLTASGADALITSNGGQTIAADALVVHAQDDRLARIINAGGNQTVDVGPGGIELTAVDGRGAAQIVNARGAIVDGTQAVSTAGLLKAVGGSTSDFRGTNSGLFQSQTGKQTVTAGSIELQAALAPVTLGGAFITNFDGGRNSEQEINVAMGTIRLTGGGVGFSNRALISSGGNQTINGNADIFVTGGSSGSGTNAAGSNNSASISANRGGTQSISAHDITLQAGPGGTDTNAAIISDHQTITASGDVRVTGGANSGSAAGARIGASGNSTAGTHLALSAHSVMITGGDTSGAALGNSSAAGALSSTISVAATGDVILTSGAGNGARIGTPNGGTGGGSIDIDAAGSIVLNGGPHAATIFTTDDVTLHGASISETASGQILAHSLVVNVDGAADLGGANRLSVFTGTSGGNMLLNNSGDLSVTGISAGGTLGLVNEGTLTLRASAGADALITSNGGQTIAADALVVHAQDDRLARIINAGGNQTVDVGAGGIELTAVDGRGAAQIVNARGAIVDGTQAVSTAGLLKAVGGSTSDFRGTNSGLFQSQTGKQTVTAGSIELQAALAPVTLGGAFITNFDGGPNSDQEINVASGAIRLTGGGVGFANRALISSRGNQTITGNADIFVTGGSSGTGTNAAGTSNSAAISTNTAGKTQSINAHNITLQAGSGGTDTFAVITSNEQTISATGDVYVAGGSNSGSANGARIGASGNSTTGTNLTLTAHDVVLAGGETSSGAAIGNSGGSALPNTIRITATGDVVLNSGLGNGARIGSASGDSGGGSVDIDATGSIVLNGGAHAATIRTAGDVTLRGASISEGANGFVVADGLTTRSGGSTLLGGANHVHRFNATSTAGDVLLTNNEALEVTGLSAFGDATLDNTGNVTIGGPWTAGGTTSITVHSDLLLLDRLASHDVVLSATSGSIQESGGGAIDAASLSTSSVGDTTLSGDNTVGTFSASSGGGITLNNSGPLTVTSLQATGAIELTNDGALTLETPVDTTGRLTLASHGDLRLTDSVNAGDLVVRSQGGNVTIGGADLAHSVVLHGTRSLTLEAPGQVLVRGSDCTVGAGAYALSEGALTVNAGSFSLVGGAAPFAPAVAAGNVVNVTTAGDLTLTGGSGAYSPALLFGGTGIDLTVGGTLRIDGGTDDGSFARVQTATRDGEIHITFTNEAGDYVVDGLDGRIKHGQDGFYTGIEPAKPGDTFFVTYE